MAPFAFVICVLLSLQACSAAETCQGSQCAAVKGQKLLQVAQNSTRASVVRATDFGQQRALLSARAGVRSSRGCKWCSCAVTSAADCGTDTVTSGAQCGWDWVTSGATCGWDQVKNAAQCGSSVTKMCKSTGRRRRWIGYKCKTSTVAKSCSVAKSCNTPKTCDLPKSCNLGSSFSECLSEITNTFSGSSKTFMKYVTDSGCTTVDGCKETVKSGLSDAYMIVEEEVQNGFSSFASSITNNVGPSVSNFATQLHDESQSMVSATGAKLASVGNSMVSYLGSAFPAFTKYDLGNVCSESGSGFWYMEGTDCGAFSDMGKIFTDMTNAQSHFKSAGNKFGTCVAKTGLLNFPTPFLDLKIESFCLPQFFVTGLEYMIGGILYGANGIKTMVEDLTGVIKEFGQNNVNLLQLGRGIAARRQQRLGIGANQTSIDGTSSLSGCGTQNNWGLEITVGLALSATSSDGQTIGFSFALGVGLGCQGGSMVTPNALLNIAMGRGGTVPPSKGAEGNAAVEIGLEWSENYASFASSRVRPAASLVITPEVDIENVLGIPAAVGVPISFGILPQIAAPSSFAFKLAPEVGLVQLGKKASTAMEQARNSALASGSSHEESTLASLRAMGEELAGPNGLKSALANVKSDHEQILSKAVAVDEHKMKLLETAHTQKQRDTPVSLTIEAEMAFKFCITPTANCS